MPKAFSMNESAHIKEALIHEAMVCLKQYGVKKTTVDDLVERVGIAKGSFYRFYPSKEHLFYDVFRREHDAIQARFLMFVEKDSSELNADVLTEMVFNALKYAEDSVIFSLMARNELEMLMRKLPPALHEDHHQQDALSMMALMKKFPKVNPKRFEAYVGAFRLAMSGIMQKQSIGSDCFDEALKLTIKGIFIQLIEENNHD